MPARSSRLPLRVVLAAAVSAPAGLGVHIADNGDGTFTNPVMPNAHWSDPAVLRTGSDYYVVTSSIETTPSLQILHSTDLVNYDVIGSVSRHWFTHTVDGTPLQKRQCWSPRLMFIAGRYRVQWHQSGHFMVAEALQPAGPWQLIHHNLTGMAQPSPQWAATTFVDTDGRTYMFAFNWIRETDAAALNWVGPKHVVADMHAVGLMENPSLMKRGDFYYWHESSNGTVTWGLAADPNDGRRAGSLSTNKGALSVWRSKTITGPYEGPRHVITSNVQAACVNTGTVVLGPDNSTWYYLYDAIDPSRWNMQRQMYVDRISFGADGWPVPRTPGRTNRLPTGGVSPPLAERWLPDLSDEFEGKELEGVSGGTLGRKWLWKQENESLWRLEDGALALRTDCRPGIESPFPANLLLQRPTAAYYRIEAQLRWPASSTVRGVDGAAGCENEGASAGLIARELNSGQGVAVGLWCNDSGLKIAAWQNTLNLLHALPLPPNTTLHGGQASYEILLRIDIELVLAQVWYSLSGGAHWEALPALDTSSSRGNEMTFEYVSTLMGWQAVGPDPAAWDHVDKSAPTDAFTTLHPGLFAGGGATQSGKDSSVMFDYFRYTDNEVFAVDEREAIAPKTDDHMAATTRSLSRSLGALALALLPVPGSAGRKKRCDFKIVQADALIAESDGNGFRSERPLLIQGAALPSGDPKLFRNKLGGIVTYPTPAIALQSEIGSPPNKNASTTISSWMDSLEAAGG